ncbi:MAG TPA: hypothetical protein VHS79_15830 [Actinomycetes bacterium]|jgi:hypothetical protein|nr:hypothetical protein [Actinomycetes bacterium]
MASTTTTRRPWTAVLQRWPTALALSTAALTFGGSESDEGVTTFAGILPLLPLLYLVVAKLRRRQAAWPALAVGFTLVVALGALDVLAPPAVLAALALVVLVWGAVDGQLHRPDQFRVQALGMLGFGALALAGLVVDPDLGRYLVAAGWFLHGVWDFVHLKLDTVVARSYAEWCGVFDVLIAAQLVFKL